MVWHYTCKYTAVNIIPAQHELVSIITVSIMALVTLAFSSKHSCYLCSQLILDICA